MDKGGKKRSREGRRGRGEGRVCFSKCLGVGFDGWGKGVFLFGLKDGNWGISFR